MFNYLLQDLKRDPRQASVTASDVSTLMQFGISLRRTSDPKQLKAAVVNVSFELASHLHPTTVQERFDYLIVKHYLNILLDISGKTNTTFTMELPYDKEFMDQLRTHGWYIEPIPAPESAEKSLMLVSNIVHTPHGGYEHQTTTPIPSAIQVRNLFFAARGVAETAPFSIRQTKATRKNQRFEDMGLAPGTALEQLWSAITQHHNAILLAGTHSVGFTKDILYDAELAQKLKNGDWVVKPNPREGIMKVTLPAS